MLLQQHVVAFSSLCGLMLNACSPPSDVSKRYPEIAKIEEALSAAPASIASIATVRDWDGTVLRTGSNEWVCFPSKPDRNDLCPMCLDPTSQQWIGALIAGEEPSIESIGIGYRKAGDCAVSDSNHFDELVMPGDDWVNDGQQIMILTPDHSILEKISSAPHSSRPYVIWKDTPYAHVVAPINKGDNLAGY